MSNLTKDQRRKKTLGKRKAKRLAGAKKAKVRAFGIMKALTDSQQRTLGVKVPETIAVPVKPDDEDEELPEAPTEFIT